ncbi:MAG: hypothetical protein FJX47_07755 [Alphaproteobacteria bacterium]|nr:hypothetical protein [Alphaproteobacteria bacterium]
MAAPKFHFLISVWGEVHTDLFLRVALPALLAPGNLGDFPWAGSSSFRVFASSRDAPRIAADANFVRLQRLMPAGILDIDSILRGYESVFARLTECQRLAIRAADGDDAALFFLNPDGVINDGYCRWAAARIVEGASAVVAPGARIVQEVAVSGLRSRFRKPDGSLVAPSRDLVAYGLTCLHPQSQSWFLDSPTFDRLPPYLFFRAGEAGLVAACYVQHPVVVRPEVKHQQVVNIWDQDWLAAACPNPERIVVATNSDDLAMFGLDQGLRFADYLVPNRADLDDVAYLGEFSFNHLHRAFARQPVFFRATDGDPAHWTAAETEARKAIAAVDARLARSDEELARDDLRHLLVRLRGRYRFVDPRFFNPPFAADTKEIGNALVDDLPRLLEVATPADRAHLIAIAKARDIAL